MPAQQHTNQLLVEVEDVPLPADLDGLLISAFVDDSLTRPDLFVLRFRDPDRIVLAKARIRIGAKVQLSVSTGDQGAPLPLLSGEVTALEVEFDSGGTFTVVRGYDHSHRLMRGRVTESYQQSTASDVATKIAQRSGLQGGRIDATSTVHDHLSQGNIDDWRFLHALADEVGYEVAVLDGKLDFRKPTKAADAPETSSGPAPSEHPLVLELGSDLLRFRSLVTASEQVKQVQVRGWNVAQKQALVGTAPAATTSAELSVTPADLAATFGNHTYVGVAVPYGSQSEVDAAAQALAEQVAGTFAEFEGVARGNPRLRAGTAVAVDNLGEPFDGKYTLTTTRHVIDPLEGYTTWFTVSGRQERSLLGLTSGGAAGGPAMPVEGVVTALVTNARDPEGRCRVKLRYPWLSDTYESDWVRTVQAGAGPDRGAVVVPEVNDEVLVAFEHGDLRRPFVVGGLHNGVDKPPAAGPPLIDGNSGAVNRRGFTSRTGHRLQFLEEAGRAEGITLSTGDDRFVLTLDRTRTTITVSSDGTVLISAKQGVKVDAGASKVELLGNQIALKSRSGIDIDGGAGDVKVRSGVGVDVQGTTVKLNGSAQTEVKGGAMCSISAAMVRIN